MMLPTRNDDVHNTERADRTYLVTGASGFIGRHLVSALIADGAQSVKTLTRSRSGDEFSIPFSSQVKTFVGDLLDHASLQDICRDVHTIFHLAGYAHADDADAQRHHEIHWRVTVEGTRALLERAVSNGVRCFVFVSTVKVYGEGDNSCMDESSPAVPLSSYGKAKLEAEKLVLAAGKQHGIHVSVLRLPLVYGRDNKGNIPRMIRAIDRGRFPPLPRHQNKRSMVHVDDVTKALLLVGASPQANGQIYNVTDGQIYSTRQLYEMIRAALGLRPARVIIPLFSLRLLAKMGDGMGGILQRPFIFNSNVLTKLTASAWYSSAKIERDLGFRPSRVLSEALNEMVESYRDKAEK